MNRKKRRGENVQKAKATWPTIQCQFFSMETPQRIKPRAVRSAAGYTNQMRISAFFLVGEEEREESLITSQSERVPEKKISEIRVPMMRPMENNLRGRRPGMLIWGTGREEGRNGIDEPLSLRGEIFIRDGDERYD